MPRIANCQYDKGRSTIRRACWPARLYEFWIQGIWVMIHFTCDRCKRELDSTEDLRYVVKLEVFAAVDLPESNDVEEDRDHLLEIHELLEHLDASGIESSGNDLYRKHSYDLCPTCHRKFIANPLGHELAVQFGFSEN